MPEASTMDNWGLGPALGADHVAGLHPVLDLGGDAGDLAALKNIHLALKSG